MRRPGKLDDVSTGDVTRAILAESTSLSVGAAQFFVAALRSFLRFCSMEGLVATDLSAAAVAVTGRRRSFLPKGINSSDAKALLSSCDRRTAVGRRDYAVIVMLLRLGLRASASSSRRDGWSTCHPRTRRFGVTAVTRDRATARRAHS